MWRIPMAWKLVWKWTGSNWVLVVEHDKEVTL